MTKEHIRYNEALFDSKCGYEGMKDDFGEVTTVS